MGQVNFKTPQQVADEALTNWRASARVSAFQARAVLARTGKLGAVKQLVEADPDSEIAIAWEYATEFKYDSAFLNQVATALGLTTEDKDELFRLAESIKA